MFDFGVGYTELFVLALIAVIVIGPKDLPALLRKWGQFINKMRGMAREFQTHVDAAMKDTGLDELKRDAKSVTSSIKSSANMPDLSAPNLMGGGAAASAARSTSPGSLSTGNDFDILFGAEPVAGVTKVAGKSVDSPPAAT
jgi:sec-independent protein translocase protein TatB